MLAAIKAAEVALSRLSAALDPLLAVLTAGDFISDIATRTTCREAEAVAGFLRELGCPGPAAQWIEDHAATDDCGDAHCRCPTCRATIDAPPSRSICAASATTNHVALRSLPAPSPLTSRSVRCDLPHQGE